MQQKRNEGVRHQCNNAQHELPNIPNYELINIFDGSIYWKNGKLEEDSFALYLRVEISPE